MAGLLYVDAPPAGATRLTEWLAANADTVGRRYASELARRRKSPPVLKITAETQKMQGCTAVRPWLDFAPNLKRAP